MTRTGELAWAAGGPEGRLTVVLPAWRAERFIDATLRDLLAQTLEEYTLLVTVDGESRDGTARRVIDTLTRARRSWRTEVWVAKERLGWVANTNRGLGLATTRRFCVMPHDDRILPGYLAAMTAALDNSPGAVLANCDLRVVRRGGTDVGWRRWLRRLLPPGKGWLLHGTALTGERRERVRTFLTREFSAVAFRGLIDREVAGPDWLIDHGSSEDFAADTTWVLKLAMAGPLVRVPAVYYRKQAGPAGAYAKWLAGGKEARRARWLAHCRDCGRVLERATGGRPWPEARRWLLARLWQSQGSLWEQARWAQSERDSRRAAAVALFRP